jgi:5-methyltetrahydrofolate--homocysteine methyltransferase
VLDIFESLKRGDVLICDGAMGTMLQRYNIPPGVMPELWNADRPEIILEILRAYVAAGSQIITANTFGGNRIRLAGAGLAARSVELSQKGVRLAREAAEGKAWVAASVGPTGQLMEPYGELSPALAEEVYAEQVTALAQAGADLIFIETQHDIEEATCIIEAAKKHTSLPVFCTFAFDQRGRTMMGLRPADAAARVQAAGGDAVGANCGAGPGAVSVALEGMRTATTLPLIAQANAGIPQVSEGAKTTWDVTPEQMVAKVRDFVTLGARVVGGCCGTGPEHIAAIVAALHA